MSVIENVSRRRSSSAALFSTGAFVLAAQVLPEIRLGAGPGVRTHAAGARRSHPSVYLGIEPDGTVFIVTHRSEMGTGIRTSLPLVAADELDADWSRVRIEQGVGDTEVRRSEHRRLAIDPRLLRRVPPRRRLGALDAGQRRGGAVERAGRRVHGAEPRSRASRQSNRKLGFGALVPAAAKLPVPKARDAARSSRRALEVRRQGTRDLRPARHHHRQGAVRPRRLSATAWCYASIEHPPVVGGTVKSVDDKAALAVKGVQQTVTLDAPKPPLMFQPLGGVAVIADNTWAALQGPQGAEDRVERRRRTPAFESEAVQEAADRDGQAAGQGRPQPRQRGRRVRQGRQGASRPPTTRRCRRTRRWSRRRPWPSSRTARSTSGRRRRTRRRRRKRWPPRSASTRRTSPAT